MKCNAACPLCDGGPNLHDDVLRLDWEHVVDLGKSLGIRPYGLGRTEDEAGDAARDTLMAMLKNRDSSGKLKAPPPMESSRFFWIHKRCLEDMGRVFQSVKRKLSEDPV